ncbi:MAG: ester cyclase [Anaerolineae bacterium]|nr:ester cyclase [Anaerolineae bacterium]
MSSEQNKRVLTNVIEEGFNKGNFAALDALFAPDYQEHQFGLKKNLQGLKEDIAFLRAGFPDFHLTIEDMIADEDKVWIRMTAQGTNLGPLLGPPTNKAMTITVMDVCRFENGRIVEHWGVPDRFAQLAQLGLLPRSQDAKATGSARVSS